MKDLCKEMKEKSNKRNQLGGIAVATLTVACVAWMFGPKILAASSNFEKISQGRLVNEADGSVIFDAEDITTLNNNIGLVENSITALDTTVTELDTTVTQFNTDVSNAKADLKNTILEYSNTDALSLNTFSDLNTAIDSLTELDTTTPYYYDTTTGTDNADEIIRYKKVNGSYYLCNEHGQITDSTAKTVDENNLAQYVATTDENLTAGTAGYANKTLYLGNGSDNITYRNNVDSPDVAFGMVYQYGEGEHIATVYNYNNAFLSVNNNVISFKRSGTIRIQYGIHCDNGKDFAGYCLNGTRTDFGENFGLYEIELNVSKNDTLYFLSSNTSTNRRTTLYGFIKYV